MNLNNESKTLFITLLSRAITSKQNIFLKDEKAEEIVNNINFDFKSLEINKWLSMYLSLRTSIIDNLCDNYLKENKNSTVIHLGCGLDSRYMRIKEKYHKWYDIDYKEVIDVRKKFYQEDDKYKMLGYKSIDKDWIEHIEKGANILIIAEGLTMYLSEKEIKQLLININNSFDDVHLIFDAYSKKAVKLSKYKNPVNKLNAKIKYGFNKPSDFLKLNSNLNYISTHFIVKKNNNLKILTKIIFNNLYCGKISKSLYKIYEYKLKN